MLDCRLSVRSAKVVVSATTKQARKRLGRLQLSARCNQTTTATLNGKVVVTVTAHRRRKCLTLSFKGVGATLSTGTTHTFTLSLPKRALADLQTGDPESASFTLTATYAGRSAHARAKLPRLRGVR